MKTVPILFSLLLSGCANAQSTGVTQRLDLIGEALPSIRHITEMKVSGDTLLFVYEKEDGFGQRFLRRVVIDRDNNELKVSPDIGKREDDYYTSYMPYPFLDDNDNISVVSQDDCELYAVQDDKVLIRQKKYLMGSNSTVPFPLSQYVQDVYMTNPNRYVFIGREPNGGRQYAMTADLETSKVDTIRQINVSPELQTWMPNTGEMVYSGKHNRLAFAYRLHPIVEIFDTDGNIIKSVKIGEDTFDQNTLEEADFESLNILHTVDVTCTPDYIYALHWSCKYSDAENFAPTIYKIGWNGNVVDRYFNIPYPLYRIAAIDDTRLIGWNGKEFVLIPL